MSEIIKNKDGFIIDMDGVLYHGNKLLEGALEFIDWLQTNGKKYLFLTNSSERSPLELSQKLARMGIVVGEEHFY
ncbi:MAG TPA: TIGR01457 family HAD-type hydrolase, partial [Clostridia bacterium]|nr:TIGR01457 family HAD-type hydrolase [Clostridia bacterium]